MNIDEKILNEINRYNSINNYILEQEALPPPPADPALDPEAGAIPPPPGEAPADPAAPAPPAAPEAESTPIDVAADPDVEEIGAEGEGDVEELDITDLVDSQKTMADKQEEYFENLFNQIKTMEDKLSEMDTLV